MPPSNDQSSESDIEQIKQLHKKAAPDDNDIATESDIEHLKILTKAKRKYVCSIANCAETFRRKDQLDRHVFHHTGVKTHACDFDGCDKVYSIETHLKRHILCFHEKQRKEKTIQCQVDGCTKKFSLPNVMERHMRQVHESRKEFVCKECGSKFRRKLHLTRHEVVAHTRDYPYKCEQCKKKFVQESNLNRHVCKSHKCDICAEQFEKWTDLVQHKKRENHNSTFKCDKCPKEFERQALLNMHKEQHQDVDREVFPCSFEGCPKFYYHNRNLTAHIKVQHNGNKFNCNVDNCGKEFATQQKLNQHMQNIHSDKAKVVKAKTRRRAKRKDAGVSKTSTLALLSGVVCDSKLEKQLRNGDVDIVLDDVETNQLESSGVSEKEDEMVVQRVIELVEF